MRPSNAVAYGRSMTDDSMEEAMTTAKRWMFITNDPRRADILAYVTTHPQEADRAVYVTEDPQRADEWAYLTTDLRRAQVAVYVLNPEALPRH